MNMETSKKKKKFCILNVIEISQMVHCLEFIYLYTKKNKSSEYSWFKTLC